VPSRWCGNAGLRPINRGSELELAAAGELPIHRKGRAQWLAFQIFAGHQKARLKHSHLLPGQPCPVLYGSRLARL
jgi:hypothetical protein